MVEAKDNEEQDEEQDEAQDEAQDKTQSEAEESKPREPSDELKIVIVLKGDRSLVGLQSPDCDPIFTPIDGGLTSVTEQLPALIESANAKWDANPRNPKAKLPEPEPAPARSQSAQTTRSSGSEQPSFF